MSTTSVIRQHPVHRLLTAREVAERLNCSIRHVWRLRSAGVLKSIQIGLGGGGTRFTPEPVERLMQEGTDA
jgi:excisionase family DNA binding protein